jgi:hypothetical protein
MLLQSMFPKSLPIVYMPKVVDENIVFYISPYILKLSHHPSIIFSMQNVETIEHIGLVSWHTLITTNAHFNEFYLFDINFKLITLFARNLMFFETFITLSFLLNLDCQKCQTKTQISYPLSISSKNFPKNLKAVDCPSCYTKQSLQNEKIDDDILNFINKPSQFEKIFF